VAGVLFDERDERAPVSHLLEAVHVPAQVGGENLRLPGGGVEHRPSRSNALV